MVEIKYTSLPVEEEEQHQQHNEEAVGGDDVPMIGSEKEAEAIGHLPQVEFAGVYTPLPPKYTPSAPVNKQKLSIRKAVHHGVSSTFTSRPLHKGIFPYFLVMALLAGVFAYCAFVVLIPVASYVNTNQEDIQKCVQMYNEQQQHHHGHHGKHHEHHHESHHCHHHGDHEHKKHHSHDRHGKKDHDKHDEHDKHSEKKDESAHPKPPTILLHGVPLSVYGGDFSDPYKTQNEALAANAAAETKAVTDSDSDSASEEEKSIRDKIMIHGVPAKNWDGYDGEVYDVNHIIDHSKMIKTIKKGFNDKNSLSNDIGGANGIMKKARRSDEQSEDVDVKQPNDKKSKDKVGKEHCEQVQKKFVEFAQQTVEENKPEVIGMAVSLLLLLILSPLVKCVQMVGVHVARLSLSGCEHKGACMGGVALKYIRHGMLRLILASCVLFVLNVLAHIAFGVTTHLVRLVFHHHHCHTIHMVLKGVSGIACFLMIAPFRLAIMSALDGVSHKVFPEFYTTQPSVGILQSVKDGFRMWARNWVRFTMHNVVMIAIAAPVIALVAMAFVANMLVGAAVVLPAAYLLFCLETGSHGHMYAVAKQSL
eukprot:Nk52_evm10s1737 gene=Nk52_evmTU10s1737